MFFFIIITCLHGVVIIVATNGSEIVYSRVLSWVPYGVIRSTVEIIICAGYMKFCFFLWDFKYYNFLKRIYFSFIDKGITV